MLEGYDKMKQEHGIREDISKRERNAETRSGGKSQQCSIIVDCVGSNWSFRVSAQAVFRPASGSPVDDVVPEASSSSRDETKQESSISRSYVRNESRLTNSIQHISRLEKFQA
jgi:hypothetical protein